MSSEDLTGSWFGMSPRDFVHHKMYAKEIPGAGLFTYINPFQSTYPMLARPLHHYIAVRMQFPEQGSDRGVCNCCSC